MEAKLYAFCFENVLWNIDGTHAVAIPLAQKTSNFYILTPKPLRFEAL